MNSDRRWTGENCPICGHPRGAVDDVIRPTPQRALPRSRLVAREAGGGSRFPHDAGGEGAADAEQRPRDSASRRAGLQLVERGAARRRPAARHGVSRAHRARRHLRSRLGAQDGRRHLHRSARQVPRGDAPAARDRSGARRRSRPHRLSGLLVAEHQHLPGSPLGARSGDLRRRSVPDQPHGRRLRQGHAGRRSALPEDHRHAEALRRAQRPRAAAPFLRRQGQRVRPGQHLPVRVQGDGHGRQGRFHHVRLQRGGRSARLRQHRPPAEAPARTVGLQGLRGERLRRDRRHLPEPQVRRDAGRRVRGGRQGGNGSDLRRRVQEPARRSQGRHHHGSRDHPFRRAAVRGAHPARHVRSAGARAVHEDSVLRERFRRAPAARARRRAEGHRSLEEPGRNPAAEIDGRQDRRRRPVRRRSDRPAGQLQRHLIQAGHAARRHREAIRESEGAVRAGRELHRHDSGARGVERADRAGRQGPRHAGGVLGQPRFPGPAEAPPDRAARVLRFLHGRTRRDGGHQRGEVLDPLDRYVDTAGHRRLRDFRAHRAVEPQRQDQAVPRRQGSEPQRTRRREAGRTWPGAGTGPGPRGAARSSCSDAARRRPQVRRAGRVPADRSRGLR